MEYESISTYVLPGVINYVGKTVKDGDYIISITAEHFNLTIKEIKQAIRKEEIVIPRQIAMYLCSKHTKLTLKKIGGMFNKNYTTVIHSRKTITNLIKTDYNSVRHDVAVLEMKLNG